MSNRPLFTPYRMGHLDLPNRIVKTKTSNVDLQERKTMSDSNAEKNKATVLKAFDTLFNKRDYTAA